MTTKSKEVDSEEDKIDSRVKSEIFRLLFRFEGTDSLDFIAQGLFKRGINIPSDKWSLLNRLIMRSHDTFDARGFKAWAGAERRVLKGKGFYILAPLVRKFKKENEKGEEETKTFVSGFRPIIVWGEGDTEGGKPIDYKIPELPTFKCQNVAKHLGVNIKQVTGDLIYKGHGNYNKATSTIEIASDSQQAFFHELCHAVDFKILKEKMDKNPKLNQTKVNDIVSEFSSVVLMKMFGLKASETTAFQYIDTYSKELNRKPSRGLCELLPRIEKIINYIVETNEKLGGK